MRVAMMTREYPPEVYGGAGVHVTELVEQLRRLVEVDVHCTGAPRDTAFVHSPDPALRDANPALTTLSAGLRMAHAAAGVDVVHSHTWYTGLAGHLAAELHDVPHILTAHSLEPRRPWKAEQLGGGYRISSWSERNAVRYADAIIAVSDGMRLDVLDAYPFVDPARVHVVRNGIDTTVWHPGPAEPGHESVVTRIGLDPDRPIVVFVGRITRQKGVGHLIAAAHHLDPDIQLVLCAGAPDTPEIAAETERAVTALQDARDGVHWVREMLPTESVRELLSTATVFVCPSVYEPLGIVNLEAMACETAVVASDVGGIPEVVQDGVTGRLVHYDAFDTETYERALADAIDDVARDRDRAARWGRAGRDRAVNEFSWAQIARQTVAVYQQVLTTR
ncbi:MULTISPECIES: glycogen synthase [Rhodococcus]|uniref:Glycogen synthase n=1 Tax=Rhodococcus sp. D-6 TaxID=1387842 RepID=A0AAU7UYT6_9NOCA|nr:MULTISPECIES: glycogen synthase [Rhodococcus]MCD2116579.1 glycogen synthase [Rhodococcus pyridinivorans]MCZ4625478.1 glycogen synthase [Rhodococcus pyridinivorans]MCZ4646688.1 glycogen synthase [Rhodococcus pyridinivorans]MDJ0483614.1 glycogen synthase [Rhodococcus pyridinivorans]MDV7252759.1 glycogen synthase [Rhodococcus pyridinivorans]